MSTLEIGISQPVPAVPWAEKVRKVLGSVLTRPQSPCLSVCPDLEKVGVQV